MITYNTSQGMQKTVATYTCNDGSTLLGSNLRICEEGVWEEASPSCLQEGKCTTLIVSTVFLCMHVAFSPDCMIIDVCKLC